MSAMGTAIVVFLVGVALNAFFAGYETGFVSANTIRVRHLAEKERDSSALRLLAYLEQPHRMITVLLLGTNIGLVMGVVAATSVWGPLMAGLIATPVYLFFGEILPKSVFRIHPTRLSLYLLPVARLFDALLTPVVLPVMWLSQGFAKLFGGRARDIRVLMTTLDDMRRLVDESTEHGAIAPEEQEMIHSIIDLHTRQAQEIMVPRIDIQALPETATRTELIELLTESGRTRIPIYRESIDNIIGVVNAFDVITDLAPEEQSILRFVKPIMHVPDTMKLDDLLSVVREARVPMAIVTDEYGGTDGLIAIEDILEEIFGEIHDEHDREQRQIRKVGPRAYVVDARMPLEDAAEAMSVDIIDEEVETVGGWVMHITGRIPAQGEVIMHGPYRITVLSGTPNSLNSLRLEMLSKTGDDVEGKQ